jgi:hypothetical protein
MRKQLFSLFALTLSFAVQAQTVATFESLTLPKAKDTSYINYSKFGKDVGFSDGLAYFPCVFDTSGGYSFWSKGFSYSNWTDSVTSGFSNQYSAKTAKGFAGSSNYLVAYGNTNVVKLKDSALGKSIVGFYATNSTYTYNSMRNGDGFSKKFKAADKDWFRLDVFAYRKDTLSKDSVSVYLADFRNADSTKNYIVSDWQWVDLARLGKVDSLFFRLQSSDVGTWGMNTPAYFCIDNFMTNETGLSLVKTQLKADIKVYPNPAKDYIIVESAVNNMQQVVVSDFLGRTVGQYYLNQEPLTINTSSFVPGVYLLTFIKSDEVATVRFIKD